MKPQNLRLGGLNLAGACDPADGKGDRVMIETFQWCGKPIHDIDAWAQKRGEKMVRVKAQRRCVDWGVINLEEKEIRMPESFWNCLQMADGWHYTEISAE